MSAEPCCPRRHPAGCLRSPPDRQRSQRALLLRPDAATWRLVRRTIDALDAYPFLCRYPPEATDGSAGRQGAFVPVSFWAVTAQALTGDLPGAVAGWTRCARCFPGCCPRR